LVPPFDGGDNPIWVFGPDEGFWLFIVLCDEAVDGGLKIDDGAEDATLEAPVAQFSEKSLNSVEPRAGRWREVKLPAWMAAEPSQNLRVLVSGVIIKNGVDDKKLFQCSCPVRARARRSTSRLRPVPAFER